MKDKLINNLRKYKYDWLSIVFLMGMLLTENIIFVILFFISVLLSEFKK